MRFESFPSPHEPTRAQIKALAEAAVALRDVHARLDAAVRAAYGMAEDADSLAFLLELNLACAAKEKAGEKITPPGLSLPPEEHAEFVTDDCIKPSVLV